VIAVVTAFALTAGLVADATGGQLLTGSSDQVFESVSIDTRTLAVGALFVALRGTRDGHDFVEHAVANGAAGLLVSRDLPRALPSAVVRVSDTLAALQALGRDVRRRSGATVVAITGSAGKTTTKEMTAEVLAARYRVFRSAGNLNNHIGLPLSLVELRRAPEMAIVELGMNRAGEIRRLVSIAEPDVRVWTNVGDAHYGFFGSRESLADAKAEILDGASAATLVVANADDPLVADRVGRRSAGRLVTFGESSAADVRATDIDDRGFDGIRASVRGSEGAMVCELRLIGRGALMNALAASAVGLAFGVPPGDIVSRLAALRAMPRRGAEHRLSNDVRLIDDSYNASPSATAMMLDALGATAVTGRRVAVLGEMLELGAAAGRLHEACGHRAAAVGVDLLVVVGGPDADGLVAGALAGGLSSARIVRYADAAKAADGVPPLIQAGDVVLVKGSRGTRTDRVADALMKAAA